MRTLLLTIAAAFILSTPIAEARCSKEEADRARQELQAFIDQNPDKRAEVQQHLQRVRAEMGNPAGDERICDIVNQVLSRMTQGGR